MAIAANLDKLLANVAKYALESTTSANSSRQALIFSNFAVLEKNEDSGTQLKKMQMFNKSEHEQRHKTNNQ